MARFAAFFVFLAAPIFFLSAQVPQPDNPEQSIALTQQADAAAKNKNWQDAQSLYLQAIELNQKNGPAWRGLGKTAYESGDGDKALTYFKEGWACGDLPSLRTLAALAMLDGEYADFLELMPDLMKQKDNDPQIRAILLLYGTKAQKDSAYYRDVMAGFVPATAAQASAENLQLFYQGCIQAGRNEDAAAVSALQQNRSNTGGPAAAN